jgi:hypothetical protein
MHKLLAKELSSGDKAEASRALRRCAMGGEALWTSQRSPSRSTPPAAPSAGGRKGGGGGGRLAEAETAEHAMRSKGKGREKENEK